MLSQVIYIKYSNMQDLFIFNHLALLFPIILPTIAESKGFKGCARES